ncbi:MAG: hypothetical protein II899_09690 [Bacteroidales bacterium]|nr:hypothetical protein [Bacteroidales bacterium]
MNIKNITNLLKTYFIENWKTDLFQFGILAAIVLFSIIMNGRASNLNFPIFVSMIFLMIYPERLFRNLHGNSPKIHYLSIPASNSEKVVANMFLANIYYVAGLVISCTLGLLLAHLYLKVRGFDGVSFYNMYDGNWAGILMIYASLAMFFFGSIYFRRRTTLSTVGVGMLISMVFSLLVTLTLWVNGLMLIPKDAAFHDYIWSFNSSIIPLSDTMEKAMVYVGLSVSIIYFYVLSFLRMKETEA